MENWRGFLKNPKFIFTHISIFSHSPFLQFSQTGKLLIFFLPLQNCVNPRLSAAKKSFPFFCFFVSSDFSPFFFHTAKLLQKWQFEGMAI